MKKKQRCRNCAYRRPLGGIIGLEMGACHYLLDTGKTRGCSALECFTRKHHFKEKTEPTNAQRKAMIFWK